MFLRIFIPQKKKFSKRCVLLLSICLIIILIMTLIRQMLVFVPEQLEADVTRLIHPFNLSKNDVNKAMNNILNNPIYKQYKMKPVKFKKDVTILIIVSSGPRRYDRRNAVRDTWWKECKQTFGVIPECLFFTDDLSHNNTNFNVVMAESKKYGDIRFQHLNGGIDFGERYLYQVIWSIINYNFDYLLRIDDDYMFCLERFLYELPEKRNLFHWGFYHMGDATNRPDESMMLFSRDVLELFLSQPADQLLCNPFADQLVAAWINQFPQLHSMANHDPRLHHFKTVDNSPELKDMVNICTRYIGVHRCYSHNMRSLWKRKGDVPHKDRIASQESRDKYLGNLLTNSRKVTLKVFNWLQFYKEWRFEPKYCIHKPTWDTSHFRVTGGIYAGEEEANGAVARKSHVFIVLASLLLIIRLL